MKILIVGANFNNKGAQSMLDLTMDELKKRFPDCEIFFGSLGENIDLSNYRFDELFFPGRARTIAKGGVSALKMTVACFVYDFLKFLKGKEQNLWRFFEAKKLGPEMDLIIDVSGFSLGDRWSIKTQEGYLDSIRLAKKWGIPIFFMPQSFGPFDYDHKSRFLMDEIRELFCYPKIIFAREHEGERYLKGLFECENVIYSTDLVLQNKGVNIENIYIQPPELIIPEIDSNDSVGVVPNIQCFNHGDKDKNIQMYKDIISHLVEKEKKVYIFRHSREDFSICKLIAEQFHNAKVVLLDNEFSCLEYDEFVKKFDFVICSRFHGCVHAYRNYIPCILLGWAIKYQELAENVGQEQYAFDITSNDFSSDKVIAAADYLIAHLNKESGIIKEHVVEIQKYNCFDQIEEWLR